MGHLNNYQLLIIVIYLGNLFIDKPNYKWGLSLSQLYKFPRYPWPHIKYVNVKIKNRLTYIIVYFSYCRRCGLKHGKIGKGANTATVSETPAKLISVGPFQTGLLTWMITGTIQQILFHSTRANVVGGKSLKIVVASYHKKCSMLAAYWTTTGLQDMKI